MCCSDEEWEVPDAASKGGSGRKLHEPDGRLETKVKISEISRCWILVSCVRDWVRKGALCFVENETVREGNSKPVVYRTWSAVAGLGR